jgi:sigma-B regulation protein RsbU (phosphoserine phosphatase)
MTPLNIILLVLALVAALGLVVALLVARSLGVKLSDLVVKQEDLVHAERRMFTYLHDLGAAIAGEQRESSLHKLIVEGAMQVTSSRGGTLYTFDETTKELVPRFVTGVGAPLTPLDAQAIAAAGANPAAVLNYMRLKTAPGAGSLLGDVFSGQTSEHVPDLGQDERLASGQKNPYQSGTATLVGPLVSGTRKLGILAVTLPNQERHYDSNDLEIFTAIAEQSAFALASAVAHMEMQHKRKLEAELHTAGEVQRILLPAEEPSLLGYSISGLNRPAKILSGDFYDYVRPDVHRFGVVVADVSGKGFPAALIAATCRSSLQAHAQAEASPSAVLSAVNRQIFDDIREDMFISAIYLVFEEGYPTIKLSRAGHPLPLVWRKATSIVEAISSPGLGLGIDAGEVFDRVTKDVVINLEPGDCMLVFTDGITEAENAEGEEFGEERLRKILCSHAAGSTDALVDRVSSAVSEFCGKRPPADDVTLVALKRTGA